MGHKFAHSSEPRFPYSRAKEKVAMIWTDSLYFEKDSWRDWWIDAKEQITPLRMSYWESDLWTDLIFSDITIGAVLHRTKLHCELEAHQSSSGFLSSGQVQKHLKTGQFRPVTASILHRIFSVFSFYKSLDNSWQYWILQYIPVLLINYIELY